jgi:hypothetical protein
MSTAINAITTIVGEPMRETSSIGSQMALPYSTTVAPVTMMPTNENNVIVEGNPISWPTA